MLPAFLTLLALTCAFEVTIPPNGQQCFSEDLNEQTLMVGSIYAKREDPNDKPLGVRVTDKDMQELFVKTVTESVRFSFTSLNSGAYTVCLQNISANPVVTIVLIKIGTEAKDYSALASTKDLKPSEVKLKRIKDTTVLIHKEVQHMREREEEMRTTNATIHNRVIGYSVCTLVFLLLLAFLQILYLRRIFKNKKIT